MATLVGALLEHFHPSRSKVGQFERRTLNPKSKPSSSTNRLRTLSKENDTNFTFGGIGMSTIAVAQEGCEKFFLLTLQVVVKEESKIGRRSG